MQHGHYFILTHRNFVIYITVQKNLKRTKCLDKAQSMEKRKL